MSGMTALLIIPALVLLGLLSVRYGSDSRPDESVSHRPNL
jgi:hypothetical protein